MTAERKWIPQRLRIKELSKMVFGSGGVQVEGVPAAGASESRDHSLESVEVDMFSDGCEKRIG